MHIAPGSRVGAFKIVGLIGAELVVRKAGTGVEAGDVFEHLRTRAG